MRYLSFLLAVPAMLTLASFANIKSLKVTSPAFQDGGPIPVKYTCLGQEVSPPLSISDIPAGAKSLAILVCDPDAVTKIQTTVTTKKSNGKKGKHAKTVTVREPRTMDACTVNGYTHWIVWNIDVTTSIPEDFRTENMGINSGGAVKYQGMCPPVGATHKYHFIVYALDTKLNIGKQVSRADFEKVIDGHILAKGTLMGNYNKNYK